MVFAPSWRRPEVLQLIFDQLPDALFLYDKDLCIVGVNLAAQRLFGLSASEMIGRRYEDIFHCATREPNCGGVLGARQTECLPRGTIRLHGGTRRERLVVVQAVRMLDEAGELEGMVASVKEITGKHVPDRLPSRRAVPSPSAGAPKPSLPSVIGESGPMRELMNMVNRVAVSAATSILLEGENGTGKDLIANVLHHRSLRQSYPFVAINCAAIPETLLESELFGHEKGAFTGARDQKRGLLDLADKGTLFLDEIGAFPLSLQAKLLRVLDEQAFRRVGGLHDIKVDLRIIAATNRNLRAALKEQAFRQDLYYRLNVIQLIVPPLRERQEDVLPLAGLFIERYNLKFNRQVAGLSAEAEILMSAHDWPGNVRELRNAIERAMILEETRFITTGSLPASIGCQNPALLAGAPLAWNGSSPLGGMSLADHERRLLVHALATAGGNTTRAAGILKITRDTMRYRMSKFGLG